MEFHRQGEIRAAPGAVLPGPRAAFAERTNNHRPEFEDLRGQRGGHGGRGLEELDSRLASMFKRERRHARGQPVKKRAGATLGYPLSGAAEGDLDPTVMAALPHPRARATGGLGTDERAGRDRPDIRRRLFAQAPPGDGSVRMGGWVSRWSQAQLEAYVALKEEADAG